MKTLFKHKAFFIIVSLITMASCQNEVDNIITEKKQNAPDIEVVEMSDYDTSLSRTNASTPILKFRDQRIYNQTIKELSNINYEQRKAFFENLGFEGAFSTLYKADMELDTIFDIEDDNKFLEAYARFQNKYDGLFVYNTENTYDLSPYLPFTDKELELVGNELGAVVIGNQIKYAEISMPNYQVEAMPLVSGYKLYPNTEYKRKQGKYSSTMQVGIMDVSQKMCVEFKSFKKKKLWTRRHPATYHVILRILTNGDKAETISTTEQAEKYLYECTFLQKSHLGTTTFNMRYDNFYSSCVDPMPSPSNHKDFKNIPVNP